ncbi:hypothetical protein LINPERPRIM_LOCUS18849 [Linum perenne]
MELENRDVVIFETDSQTVVFALQQQREDRSEFGGIIRRCKEVIARKRNFNVRFARRIQNKVALAIARQSCSVTTHIWGEVPPGWLSDLLVEFCTVEHDLN